MKNELWEIYFGFGGNQYALDESYKDKCSQVLLEDGRIVSLDRFTDWFEPTGKLSIPKQPTRVEQLFKTTEGLVAPARLDKSGKNYLVQRLEFNWGKRYRVGPEAYGGCLVGKEGNKWIEEVMIRLPMPCAEAFLEPTRWSDRGSALKIIDLRPVAGIYQTDTSGDVIRDEKDLPIMRPYVWATGPFVYIKLEFESELYRIDVPVGYLPMLIELPDGRLIEPESWCLDDLGSYHPQNLHFVEVTDLIKMTKTVKAMHA